MCYCITINLELKREHINKKDSGEMKMPFLRQMLENAWTIRITNNDCTGQNKTKLSETGHYIQL